MFRQFVYARVGVVFIAQTNRAHDLDGERRSVSFFILSRVIRRNLPRPTVGPRWMKIPQRRSPLVLLKWNDTRSRKETKALLTNRVDKFGSNEPKSLYLAKRLSVIA